ncbi:MAG TPA: DUF2267 domain-containing protein [Polyangia bacterium]
MRAQQHAEDWLREMMAEMRTDDHNAAYVALRAGLQALRDRLPVNEAAKLAAQLPLLLRGLYYENWRPAVTPVKTRDRGEFFDLVRQHTHTNGGLDPNLIVLCTWRLLNRHVSPGELESIEAIMPPEIRSLLAESVVQASL